jgi:predicted transcriptional regulator
LKTKRTFNISGETIATVKRLAEVAHVAPTQDAVVEYAIAELARQARDLDDARAWERAASDPEFVAEAQAIESEFQADDREAFKA